MMNLPGPRAWKVGFMGWRLRELGQHLAELSRRVRETVAEVIRETIAQVARDAVDRVLPTMPRGPITQEQSHDAGEFDPWTDDEEPEPRRLPEGIRAVPMPPEDSSPASGVAVGRSALALALAAAGWWLGRCGSWWGACAIGLVAGAGAAVTRRLTGDGLLLVQAAHEFLTYRQAFSDPGAF
jgi:hypothetical protein